MTKCILIFENLEGCIALLKIFEEKSIKLSEALIVKPEESKIDPNQLAIINDYANKPYEIKPIEEIRILNTKLDRKIRQTNMRKWLLPFGFLAGLTFSNMTNLNTFSFLGLNNFGESILGGLLGMCSGLLGSIFASGSINLNRNKEIRSLINLNKNGKWFILVENQIENELPWFLIRDSESKDIIFLEG